MQEIANTEFNYVSNLGMFCNFDIMMVTHIQGPK